MISTNEKLAKKQRKILGPLGRLLLKVFRWEICMGMRFKSKFFWSSLGIYEASKFIYYI